MSDLTLVAQWASAPDPLCEGGPGRRRRGAGVDINNPGRKVHKYALEERFPDSDRVREVAPSSR